MPRVQIAENVVRPAETTAARFRAADNGGGVGGAIGAGLVGLGGALNDRAQVQQRINDELDDTASRSLLVDFHTQARPLITEYRALSGMNATARAPEVEKQLATMRRDLVGKATTRRMKQLIGRDIDAVMPSYMDEVKTHSIGQLKVETAKVNAARVTTAAENAASSWERPDVRDRYISDAMSALDDVGADQGWAPEVTATEKLKARSGIHRSIIGQLLSSDQIDAAARYQRDHAGDMIYDDRVAAAGSLKGPLERRESISDFTRAVGINPVPGAALPAAGGGPRNPVENGVAAVQAVYPNARVTSGYRAADHPLSKANPRSWHTNSHAAVDVAPIRGMSFDDYVQGYRDAGYTIIEAKDEVGAGRSRHATGDHWHVVLGSGGNAATGAQQAPRKWDLNNVYGRIDKLADSEGWSIERRERAKDYANQQVARDEQLKSRAEEAARDTALDAMTKLGDRFTSLSQLPANVQSGLSSADRFRFANEARGNAKAAAAEAERLNALNAMLQPGVAWNRFDGEQRKLVDAAVKARGNTAEAAFGMWEQTGILASQAVIGLRGGLVSTDPRQVRASANIAGNMLRRDPNAFAGVSGGEEIEKAALAFNHYVFDLGMSPADASARIGRENTPEFRAKIKVGQPVLDEYRKRIRKTGADNAALALGGSFASRGRQAEANSTYTELTLSNLNDGHDLATAQAIAAKQMKKIYGVSRDGKIRKYPPERAYPAVGGSFDYIYRDAAVAVSKATGRTVDPSQVHLSAIAGVTDDDMRNGRPARYGVIYEHEVKGQKVRDVVPGYFTADVASAVKAETERNGKAFKRAQADQRAGERLRRQMQADPAFRSGTGAMR